MLRVEKRNAAVPVERKPDWIKAKLNIGPEYVGLKNLVQSGRPVHRLRRSRLPEYFRVLGRP